jgi:type IV pilus assembly protein PilE
MPSVHDIMDTQKKSAFRLKAMTLTELLVVLAILGILVLMAFPVVMPLFQKARSTEAKIQLKHLCTLEKTFFLENAHYGRDLKEIGFQQAPLESEGGTAHYRIEIVEASTSGFVGRAIAATDFDGDGQMNIWEVNQTCQPKEVVED